MSCSESYPLSTTVCESVSYSPDEMIIRGELSSVVIDPLPVQKLSSICQQSVSSDAEVTIAISSIARFNFRVPGHNGTRNRSMLPTDSSRDPCSGQSAPGSERGRAEACAMKEMSLTVPTERGADVPSGISGVSPLWVSGE